ncbi:hypothetical protein OF897_05465 [Chryseobacterium formosus]|uniref:Lumazine-binding protein n=1 Tax=Chryseobacterium formosus TaxID=1537363 RepID=A0ABT3XPV6_9FLAO|nr:hypothetical protein [Chryseobacterium formosus]MCX8523363.1 hypothetical protein [Chryseobacterium formosus]
MNRKIRLSFLLILSLNSLIFSQENEVSLKTQAKQFSLDFVKAYFQKGCKNYDLISNSVIILDGDGIVEKKKFKDKLCESFNSAIRNKSKTYKDYIDNYIIEIYTPQELIEKSRVKLPGYYVPTETDYFFFGNKLKDENNENFIWDDMFIFMVRKENNTWFFKGASG